MERLVDLREFCESLPKNQFSSIHNLLLSIDEWTAVEEIKSILVHFAIQTKTMQNIKISLSDFFGGWAKIKFELNKLVNSELSRELLAEMKKREPVLFNNQVLNAAVFLDPRYQQYMPSQHRENAIKFLIKLHRKIESIKSHKDDCETSQSESTHDFDGFLSTIYGDNNTNVPDEITDQQQTTDADENIETMLRDYVGTKDALKKMNIFDYWQANITAKAELCKLALIVHSVPPTQTTVERAFSAMALVLSPLRTNLSDKNLENILLIRLNRDLFEDISPLE